VFYNISHSGAVASSGGVNIGRPFAYQARSGGWDELCPSPLEGTLQALTGTSEQPWALRFAAPGKFLAWSLQLFCDQVSVTFDTDGAQLPGIFLCFSSLFPLRCIPPLLQGVSVEFAFLPPDRLSKPHLLLEIACAAIARPSTSN
jgi:hypothetical protein